MSCQERNILLIDSPHFSNALWPRDNLLDAFRVPSKRFDIHGFLRSFEEWRVSCAEKFVTGADVFMLFRHRIWNLDLKIPEFASSRHLLVISTHFLCEFYPVNRKLADRSAECDWNRICPMSYWNGI